MGIRRYAIDTRGVLTSVLYVSNVRGNVSIVRLFAFNTRALTEKTDRRMPLLDRAVEENFYIFKFNTHTFLT